MGFLQAVIGPKPSVGSATGGTSFGKMVANVGKDCWWECEQKSGFCNFCGAGNACCREGEKGPAECQGEIRFQTWHHECIAPVQGLVKAGSAQPPATSAQSLVNIGKDCWWECGKKSGTCPFCGTGNACCRRGYDEDTPNECKGALAFTTWHHECVVPINSKSTELMQKIAAAGAAAAAAAADKGMTPEEQAQQAALAIGKLAKQEGLSAQSAGQIAAAGAQEAAKKNGESLAKQQELAVMASALAATEAAQDGITPEQKAAEIGLAVAEAASAAGMSFEEQVEAAATAIGTFAGDTGLSPQQAAKIAADGAKRAAKAAGKDQNQVAATAAAIAAAKAARGKKGEELASIIAGAVVAATPGMNAEEQLTAVRSALSDNAAAIGLTPEALTAVASKEVHGATGSSNPVRAKAQTNKGNPYEQAMAAGKEAFETAVKEKKTVAEQVAAAHDASKKAALAAGVTEAEAETLANGVANALSGGAKEPIDTSVVTLKPSLAASPTGGNPETGLVGEETPAEKDAAVAGAEAARLAAAGGQNAEEQMNEAAIAAGRAAINGGMDKVGAVEAARKAATFLGCNIHHFGREGIPCTSRHGRLPGGKHELRLAGIKAGLSATEARHV